MLQKIYFNLFTTQYILGKVTHNELEKKASTKTWGLWLESWNFNYSLKKMTRADNYAFMNIYIFF